MKKNSNVQLQSAHDVSVLRFSLLKKRKTWLALFVLFAFVLNTIAIPLPVRAAADDFTITKTVDKSEVFVGENFTYTINYANSNSNATNAIVTDVLPSNVVYVSSEGSTQVSSIDKTGTPGNETVIFHFANPLPSGSSGILKITVKFPEGTTVGGAANAANNNAVISSDPVDDKISKTSNAVTVIPKVNAPDWSVTKSKIIPIVTPAIGQPVTYQITVRGNSVLGGLNMENVVISDTIPANATYISSSDGGVYDPGTGIITFPPTTLAVGQTINRQIILIYNDPVTITDSATNSASVTGTPLGSVTPVSLGPVTVTHGFAASNFAVANFTKTARQENDRYSIGQEAVFYLGSIANTGNVPMDSFEVVDTIPDIIRLNSITAGSYNQAANVVISYKTNLNTSYRAWTTLANPSNQTFLVADLIEPLIAGEWVTQVRWEITGSNPSDGIVPGFSIQNPLTLKAEVLNTASSDITNDAALTAYRGVDTPIVKTASKTIYVIGQMPWLVPEKTVHASGSSTYTSTASVNMKGTLYFRLRIQNHPYATGSYIDPVAVDVLPAALENITYTGYALSSGSVVMSAPVVSAISGNRWVFNFTGALTPGDYVDIFYTATIKDLTTVGLYENDLYISTLDNAVIYQNSPSEQLTDTADWDSDTVTTDRFVKSTATFFVNFSGSLTSQKLMKGSQDAGWVTTGATLPGGVVNYQITIENSGSNGPISNIVAIDQLPAIGDKTVLGGALRSSEWRPYLVNQITYKIFAADETTEIFPAGAVIHVYYSTSSVVSTAELSNPISGVPDASWSLTPPADITTVRAVKFIFTGFGLEKNQKIVVEWPMRAPYDAPVNLNAYNSFAYGATYLSYVNNIQVDTPFLPAEPNKVDFVVHDPTGYTFNIGNFVWEDSNKNGIQDAGENGINGVLVNLYDSFGTLVSYTRTGNSQGSLPGYYLFPNIPAANGYYLEFVYPQNYQVTDYHTGSGANASTDSDILDSPPTIVTDLGVSKYSVKTAAFDLTADNLAIDAGLYQYASLGDRVWNDRDADGIQDAGEPGISGIVVDLLDGVGTLITSTTTDGSGMYSFTNLDPGTYQVRFTNPSGNYKFSLPDQGSNRSIDSNGVEAFNELTATSGLITLTSGQVDLTVDQGMYQGRVGDFVFVDSNANGIRNSGEGGFANVVVRLYTSAGELVGTPVTTTTANPNYLFDNLIPGDYYITIQPPEGAKVTFSNVGADDEIDSDVDRTTLKSADFRIDRGERDMTIDVGVYNLASLGNLVWYDQNGDGTVNGVESGLAGVSVTLLNANGTAAFNDNGILIDPVTTSNSGAYSFTGLRPGNYIVKFDLPSTEYVFSPQNVGGAGIDNNSDPNPGTGITNTITLVSGTNNNSIDAGMRKGMIGDFVWQDTNANGRQDAGEPGMLGVTVELYKVGTPDILATRTTGSNGYYSFTELDSGIYYLKFTVGGVIWFATPQNAAGSTASNDSNIDTSGLTSNITQLAGDINLFIDAGYYRKASVGDRIWNDIDGDGVQDAGEDGIPGVTVTLTLPDNTTISVVTDINGNYLFSDLVPGNYTVSINTAGLPANYQQSYEKDGNLNGSVAVVLSSGSAVTDVDFGYYVKSSIGDFVWQDTNADGIQDAGEPGLPGITVRLYNNSGIEIDTKTTDVNGKYLFADILVGTYTVGITVPASWVISPYLAGADNSLNSDVQLGTGISAGIVVLGGQNITNVDAGLYQKASVGDRLWNDIDGDGVQDAGEGGIPGVTVTLTLPNNTTVSVVTDADGNYLFSNLDPGNYTVSIDSTTLPANYQQSYEKDGSFGGSVPVTLSSNSAVTDVDFGYYVKSSIGDLVWQDTNADGIQDPGEPGLPGIAVRLYNNSGIEIDTKTTDANGKYLFSDLLVGTYTVGITVPADSFISPYQAGSDSALDSDVNVGTGITENIVILGGENITNVDAGLYKKASVGDRIWNDINGDGVQDLGEAGIPNVKVILTFPDNSTLTVLTDATGNYLFDNIIPGNYTISIDTTTLPANYQQTYEKDSSYDGSVAVVLSSGSIVTDVDFGYYVKSSIGDVVWQDNNADGIQDAGEPGLQGITVTLYNAVGGVVDSKTTDADGKYLFADILVGTYTVGITVPASWVISPYLAGADNSLNSDVQLGTGISAGIVVLGGQNITNVDAGLYQKASVGDRVWNDVNGDGVQDAGEAGIPGVTVTLTFPDNSTVSVLTDTSGNYLFSNLDPGNYTVSIDSTTLPANYQQSYEKDGSLGGSVPVTLISNSAVTDVDFGYYVKSSIGDLVWQDTNADGIQDPGEPGLPGVIITLYNSIGTEIAATTTDSYGNYLFEKLLVGTYTVGITVPADSFISPYQAGSDNALDSDVNVGTGITENIVILGGENITNVDAGLYKKASVGDRIWNDINGDGMQGAGEVGIPNVKVILTFPDNSTLTVLTDATGNYLFDNIIPGNYTISIDTATLPANYQQTYEKDSSHDGSVAVVLSSGSIVTDVDFGYYVKSSIGDVVWQDNNADGIQDAGEPGLPGVTVSLYNAAGTVAATTVTDANGNYLFTDLLVGNYTVGVTVKSGWVISPYLAGSDRSVDSSMQIGTGISAGISVLGGQNITSIDAGLYQLSRIGDTVWYDLNGNGIQDELNSGAEGVTVDLLDSLGRIVASTTTDVSGSYLFTNLVPGQYQIRFTAPVDYAFTVINAPSSSDAKDSDPAYTTGLAPMMTLISGESNISVDAGLTKAGIEISKKLITSVYDPNLPLLDDASAMQGNDVTYIFQVINTGTTYLKNITITDTSLGISRTDMTLISGTEPLAPGASLNFYYTTKINGDLLNTAATTGIPCTPDGTVLSEISNPTDEDSAQVRALASVGDRVWNDLNANGLQDSGEPGIANVKVTLTLEDGLTLVVQTDADGKYLFSDLVPGTYTVTIDGATLPANVRQSFEQDGTNNGAVSVVLHDGSVVTNIDFGYYIPASVGDRIWDDTNGDGVQDPGEPGMANVKVTLTLPDGTTIVKITDANGNYIFTDLVPGNYTISIDSTTLPVNTHPSYEADGSMNGSVAITLISNDQITNVDFGYYVGASVGNYVWIDTNRDGIQQDIESGISNVTVRLYSSSGIVIGETKTDLNGRYLFSDLEPGSYYITFVSPSNYIFSSANKGSNADLDSNPDAAGLTAGFTLVSGSRNETIDAGLLRVTAVSGTVVDNDGKPVPGAVVVITDAGGTTIGTTTTGVNGDFIIRDVAPNQVITITATKPGFTTIVISVSLANTDVGIGNQTLVKSIVKTGEANTKNSLGAIILILSALVVLSAVKKKRKTKSE